MKILIIGSGGREYALVRSLYLSPKVDLIHAIPGSDAISEMALCHSKDQLSTQDQIKNFLKMNPIDFVIVGPEIPLVEGIADRFEELGVPVVGPKKEAAQLEGSKIFAKEFMQNNKVLTAKSVVVESKEQTLTAIENFKPPYVLKADGLAGGKGVVLCENKEEVEQACVRFFDKKEFGLASDRVLVEECIHGYEMSLILLFDGKNMEWMPVFQDHKRLNENQTGPNTGGMGVIGPVEIAKELKVKIQKQVLDPTISGLKKFTSEYKGFLFIGLMVDEKNDPYVLEYNVRLGDPEAQGIVAMLDGDWADVFDSVAKAELKNLKWKNLKVCGVTLASPGYPISSEAAQVIEGNPFFESPLSYFVHAGTKKENKKWQTNGGRVMTSMGFGSSYSEAIENAYTQSKAVSWKGLQFRKDIGKNYL